MKFTDEGLHQQAIAAAKSKFKIWPSAYASGWMTRHYRQLYKAKKGRSRGAFKGRSDSLKEWFSEDWKAINSSGKIVGGCGDGETKGKVKCLPASKARSLSKKSRSHLAKRKQKQDPNPNREGAPVMVSSKKREDTMSPEVFAQAILSIEQNYGLRLDARSVWLRMDDWKRLGRDQMGQKCGRGWQGLRGACKRVPKGGDKDAAIKASKVALADKIRKRKGLADRNAPKVVAKVEKKIQEFIPKRMEFAGGRGGSKPWVAFVPGTTDDKYGVSREFVEADTIKFRKNGKVDKAYFDLKRPGVYVDSENKYFLVKADPKTGQLISGGVISRNEIYHAIKNDRDRWNQLNDPFHEDSSKKLRYARVINQ